MDTNLPETRSARKFLEQRVRNDWQYPAVPPARSASDEEVRDAQGFRELYYGESSESSDASSSSDEERGGGHSSPSPYKFDDPDSVGRSVCRVRQQRRKRRRLRLEEELEYNEGLRVWVGRREAWTGMASVRKYGARRRVCRAECVHARLSDRRASCAQGTVEEHDDRCIEPDGLVPVAPLLLADNAVRLSITPKAYPDIFQKIVISSRTPSVPINLADMTRTLVQGWKDNDEWPPKTPVLDPLAGKRRHATASTARFLNQHPHLEKGMGSVKRMLHLDRNHV